jgi:hopanoid-associated phosphorylase
VLAVCGLKREAALVAGPEVATAVSGGRRAVLEAALSAIEAADAVISFGLAGAVDPGLAPGDWIVATEVVGEDGAWAADPRWTKALVAALQPRAHGRLLGGDAMLVSAAAKRAARDRFAAVAVDMESHLAARAAARLGAPFAAIRVISDDAQRDLPAAVRVGLNPDGSMAMGRVLWALARDPGQLPALIRTGRDAGRAFRALADGRRLLGPRIGLPDLRQLPLDVA